MATKLPRQTMPGLKWIFLNFRSGRTELDANFSLMAGTMKTARLIASLNGSRVPRLVLLGILSIFGPPSGMAAFAQTIQTSVPHAILINSASRSVLFEKDADALVIPASTAKIMTAEIVFNEIALGHLKLDDQFLVSETAWRYGGAPARGSAMFAAPNSQVRVEDLIRGLVIDFGQ